jgi:hypothetical protein
MWQLLFWGDGGFPFPAARDTLCFGMNEQPVHPWRN